MKSWENYATSFDAGLSPYPHTHSLICHMSLVASLMSLTASLVTTSSMQQYINVMCISCIYKVFAVPVSLLYFVGNETYYYYLSNKKVNLSVANTQRRASEGSGLSMQCHVNPLVPRQNGHHFADDILKWIFVNGNFLFQIKRHSKRLLGIIKSTQSEVT